MQDASQNPGHIVPVVMLQIMRAVHRVELGRRQPGKLAGITHDIGLPFRIDIEQEMLEGRILWRKRDAFGPAANVQHFLHNRLPI